MILRIHYTVKGIEDSFIVTGEDLHEVAEKVDEFFRTRGLEPEDLNAWSEELPNA